MATRFSPTVVADTRGRERPGLDVARAFEEFREAQMREEGLEFEREEREFAREDRTIEAEERERRRGREDISDALLDLEFERLVREELGGVPSEPKPTAPGPRDMMESFAEEQARLTAPTTGDRFIEGRAEPLDLGPPEVAVLPGQFVGGMFSPQAVTVPRTRELAGRTFEIDPSRTAEARQSRAGINEQKRRQAEQERALQEEINALLRAGVDPRQAEAVARFDLEEEFVRPEAETVEGFDRDAPGAFRSRQDFLNFERELAEARRAPPGTTTERGPITLKDAFAEVDNLFGVWEGDALVGHSLPEGERLRVAQAMAAGTLEPGEVDRLVSEYRRDEPAPPELGEFESGPIGRFFQRILPGGRTGQERRQLPKSAEAVARPRPETPIVPSREPPAVDTIRTIIDENPDMDPDTLREILLEEFSEEEVNLAFGRR